ncbi:MAG TPA: serine/threonine-protein kinase [Isosphaeraceae bacterium]|nr:serine/threonine-protein kinase [Isosphaeraceae bacterium]
MNAMAREKALDETLDHVAGADSASDGPAGAPDMPNTTPHGQDRYVFSSGARPLEGYTIKRAIGRGGFGEVYYATSDAGKEVALKLLTRNVEIERRGVMQCMNLKSPNLITIYDLKSNDEGDTFVIMEYVSGASLANLLRQHPKGMPLSDVRMWLKGLVDGVAYLHDHGIVHRDLKPANMFMEQGIVKIGDYGLSKLITQSRSEGHSESIGTCHYMAPEISTGKYHKPIDIYASGVMLYEMLTGRVPFDGETVGEVLMKHLTAMPDLSPLPEPFRTIVGKALAKDPARRQASVYELLPASDAPKKPTVRFIGSKNDPPPPPEPVATEEVMRIGMEEPVYYIGPDTKPPVRRPTLGERFWAATPGTNRGPRPAPARPARPPRRPAPAAVVAPPAPPPLPSARVRVAELASSMLWSAPLAALLALPAYGLLGVELTRQPEQMAYLFGLTLLGTWGVLVPNKLWEGRAVDTTTRRLVYLAIGLVVGAIGMILGNWTQLNLQSGLRVQMHIDPPANSLVQFAGPLAHPSLLGYMTYFGILFGLNGWWKMTARGRPTRLRLAPMIKSALVALALGLLWPFPQPWGVMIVVLVAMVTQLVSPWSETAAVYNRAMGRSAA